MRPWRKTEFEVSSCEGKQGFVGPNLARTVAKRRRGRVAYHCRVCGLWHVGTNDKKKDRIWRK